MRSVDSVLSLIKTTALFALSVFFLSASEAAASNTITPEDCIFGTVLSTRNDPSEITMCSGCLSYLNNTSECSLQTLSVYSDAYNHGLACDGGYAEGTGSYASSLSIDYSFSMQSPNASQTPSSGGKNEQITSSGTILTSKKYETITQNYNYYNFTWAPSGSPQGVNKFDGMLNTITIDNIAGEDLQIGEFITKTYNSTALSLTGIPDIVEIYNLQTSGSNNFTIQTNGTVDLLEAQSSIDIEMLNFTSSSQTDLTLKAPIVVVGDMNLNNDNNDITIYADEIYIDEITFGQRNSLTIHPYTPGQSVAFYSRQITISSTTEMTWDSGDYYVGSFSIPGSGQNVSFVNASSTSEIINLYIASDFTIGNNFGINSGGTNGNFGTNPAENFRIFVNGDLTTGGGGTTFNALVYVEDTTSFGSPTYVKGAVSSGNDITIGNASYFYPADDDGGWGDCSDGGGGGDSGTYTSNGMDAIESTYSYSGLNADHNITTKIAYKDFDLKLVLLDANGYETPYSSPLGYEMVVIPTLCTDDDVSLLGTITGPAPTFTNGVSQVIAYDLTVPQTHRDDRVKMGFLDWSQVMDWPSATMNCVQTSSTSGNYKGVPQCLNSESKIETLFPADEYPYVHDVCLGNALTLTGSQVPACQSNAYSGWSVNSAKTIMPEEYRHVYGCYQCLLEAVQQASVCSTDNFASRPEKYDIDSSDIPAELDAGEEYDFSFTALNYGGSIATDFDNIDHNFSEHFDIGWIRYESDETTVNSNVLPRNGMVDTLVNVGMPQLAGTATLRGTTSYSVEGESRLSITSGTEQNILRVSYNNVGKVTFVVFDENWSEVDNDDTPMDCDDTHDHTYICGEMNATIIAEDFNVSSTISNRFLYLYDFTRDRNGNVLSVTEQNGTSAAMAGQLNLTITAIGANNEVLTNYDDIYGYAKDIDVNLTYQALNITPAGALTQAYVIESVSGARGTDNDISDGTNSIIFTNPSKAYQQDSSDTNVSSAVFNGGVAELTFKINFNRDRTLPVNPFELNITSVSVSNPDMSGGQTLSTNNSFTYLYGRVHAPRYRVEGASTENPVPLYYEFYSDDSDVGLRRNFASDTNRSSDAILWFINSAHATASDGRVTSTSQKNGTAITQSDLENETNTTTAEYAYNGTVYPYKGTIDINASEWLIYNRYDSLATQNEFEIEFNENKGLRQGTSGHAPDEDDNVSTNTSRRINW